ncbi:hypothetical protein [Falsarthrobacter nasiphocae]|uniref:SatD family (SatD) n=1 Tax=Falsarthrobacter nasiphocae TaxID=189863 RepID=A0AAE3YGB7_9MICC|nr:hypothetical protein [Falsarthrobacter nasiphocae]MDR6891256.1 hypothetical protein [Falsarthrobacter nasiphocae]
MFVLTLDQRDSTHLSDAVPGLLALLGRECTTTLPFERTAGDEVQALFASAQDVVDALTLVLRHGGFAAGLGVGPVDQPLPDSTRAARGPAYTAAREAVEAAKLGSGAQLAVVAHADDSRTPTEAGEEVSALVWPWAVLVAARTQKQWEALDALREHGTQKAAAEALGRTPQALSKLVRAAHAEELQACALSVSRALARLDRVTGGGDRTSGTRPAETRGKPR